MAGDRALRNLGTLLSRYTANGIACRLGGDEFLLFLPDISAENVSKLTTRLFHHFHSIAEADPEIKDAALSAGLYMCTTSDTFADCYSKADKALYNVKQMVKSLFLLSSDQSFLFRFTRYCQGSSAGGRRASQKWQLCRCS